MRTVKFANPDAFTANERALIRAVAVQNTALEAAVKMLGKAIDRKPHTLTEEEDAEIRKNTQDWIDDLFPGLGIVVTDE